MLIFLTNKVLSQRALDDNRLWEMVLEDHQKIVVLEAQLESLKTSINDLQRDLRDMKKGESRITWLVISNHVILLSPFFMSLKSLCKSLMEVFRLSSWASRTTIFW